MTITSTTLQAAALSALSNVLAQAISTYQAHVRIAEIPPLTITDCMQKPFSIDWTPIFQFVVWACISTPPNIYWQEFLESSYPSNKIDEKGEKRLSKLNTLKKFVLDQTLSAAVNNAAFIAGLGTLKGKDWAAIQYTLQHDFWTLMMSGWKVWPLVSILNYTLVPPNSRILFGSIVGLFWGIYVSLLSSG